MSTNQTVNPHRRMIEGPLPIGLSHTLADGNRGSFLHCMNDPQPEGHMASYIARRKFLATLLGGAAVAWPRAAHAQQPAKVPRVGILSPAASETAATLTAFREAIRDLGYIEGQTI